MAKDKPIMSFMIASQKFSVYGHPDETYDAENSAYATTQPTTNTIHLWSDYYDLPASRQQQVLWHEIVHCIFNAACFDLYSNENLVETVSLFIHQVITTWKE